MDLKKITQPESLLEKQIMSDPEWIEGASWGMVRENHPEGKIINHIIDILENIDKLNDISIEEYEKLRLLAIIHDTFKYRVDITKPKIGRNNHAVIARIFAEKYIDDRDVLKIIEQHDEAFNAWRKGVDGGDWKKAQQRLNNLVRLLGENIKLYYLFYKCDNKTEGKDQECVRWFEKIAGVEKDIKDKIKIFNDHKK